MGELRKVANNLGLFSQVRVFCCPVGKKGTDFTVMLKIVPYIYTFTRIEGYFALGFFQSLPDVDDAAKRRAGLGLRATDGFFRVVSCCSMTSASLTGFNRRAISFDKRDGARRTNMC